METTTTGGTLPALHQAIAKAARNGASYKWIAGVLAGCLAAETSVTQARATAFATLTRPSVNSARPPEA